MLSVFPELLFLSPLAATLLRVTAASYFLYAAYVQYKKRESLAHMKTAFGTGMLVVWMCLLLDVFVGTFLLVGLYTQVMALVGAIGTALAFFCMRAYMDAIFLSRGTLLLLFVLLVSLLVTGAGPFALDLPL